MHGSWSCLFSGFIYQMEALVIMWFGPLSLLFVVLACSVLGPGSFREMVKTCGIWHALVSKCHGLFSSVSLAMFLSLLIGSSVGVVVLDFFFHFFFDGGVTWSLCLFVAYTCALNVVVGWVYVASLYACCVSGKPVSEALGALEYRARWGINRCMDSAALYPITELKSKGFKFFAVEKFPTRILALSQKQYDVFVEFLRIRQASLSMPSSLADDVVGCLLGNKSVCVVGSEGVLFVLDLKGESVMGSLSQEETNLVPRKPSEFTSFFPVLVLCCVVGWLGSLLAIFMLICPGVKVASVNWILGVIFSCTLSFGLWATMVECSCKVLIEFSSLVEEYKKTGESKGVPFLRS